MFRGVVARYTYVFPLCSFSLHSIAHSEEAHSMCVCVCLPACLPVRERRPSLLTYLYIFCLQQLVWLNTPDLSEHLLRHGHKELLRHSRTNARTHTHTHKVFLWLSFKAAKHMTLKPEVLTLMSSALLENNLYEP